MAFYSRVTCIVALVLVLAGVGLDLAFYPEHVTEFAMARVLVALLIGTALWAYSTPAGNRNMRVLTFLWLSLPQLMIAWMIFSTNGEASHYFVGMIIPVACVGVFLPLTTKESIAFSAFTIAIYVMACASRPHGIEQGSLLLGQLIFFAFFAFISYLIAMYGDRWRLRTYVLQTEIKHQSDMLLEQNKAMATIKGQLVQREKMAAIGTLSAGLLHELNNPVNYSLMAIDVGMAQPAAMSDTVIKESLQDAHEGMKRIQNIVSDLKRFAYQQPGEDSERPFLLENAVRSAVRLASFDLKGIQVSVDLPKDTHVLGDEPAIIGVLINLLSNAAHAVHGAKRPAPSIGVRVESDQKRLKLSVRDNGLGIAQDVIGKIFDPFFTTRGVGSGLGLGLSMSYSIVQRHGSTLVVNSEPGAWTEFNFDLSRP